MIFFQGDSTRCIPTSDESEAQQPSRPPRRKKMRNENGSTMRRRKSVRSTKTDAGGDANNPQQPASATADGARGARRSVRSVKRSGTMRRQQGNTVGSLRKRSSLRKTGSVKRRTITAGGGGDQKGKGDIYTKVAIPR